MFTNHWFKKVSLEDISILTLDVLKNITAKYTKQRLAELTCETDNPQSQWEMLAPVSIINALRGAKTSKHIDLNIDLN